MMHFKLNDGGTDAFARGLSKAVCEMRAHGEQHGAHLLQLRLKRAGQHVGEEAQRDGQEQLRKGDDDEEREGDHPEEVGSCARQLLALAPRQPLTAQLFHHEPGRDAYLEPKELEAHLRKRQVDKGVMLESVSAA